MTATVQSAMQLASESELTAILQYYARLRHIGARAVYMSRDADSGAGYHQFD
jgi:hypothetical protein